ncbi:MAG: tetratricopeptide repeat protein [Deltaproteobacteria bacterium]|nr:tetratricopeptide repeat protein [Deltaproteobacteria bacterium]
MDNIPSMIEEAKFFFHSQKYAKAEELFKKVVAQRKEFADIHNFLGLIAHEEGRYSEAVKCFTQALKINPRYTEAMLNLSILYNDLGQHDNAKKLVSQSRKDAQAKKRAAMDPFIRSKLANKHADVADWYKGVGLFKEAVDEYKRALYLEEGYADIRTRMGVCLREMGDTKGAIEELKKAVSTRDKCVDAHIQLGITKYALGKRQEARKVWQDASKKFPSNTIIKMYCKLTEK